MGRLQHVIRRRNAARGQNLVEMALVFPFLIAFILFTMEIGNVWYTYEAAKMAAMEGAHTASIYHSATVGKQAMDTKLTAASLTVKSSNVTQVANKHAYEANITVTYQPFFGGLSIPSLGGNLSIIPGAFDINYTAIRQYSVY